MAKGFGEVVVVVDWDAAGDPQGFVVDVVVDGATPVGEKGFEGGTTGKQRELFLQFLTSVVRTRQRTLQNSRSASLTRRVRVRRET